MRTQGEKTPLTPGQKAAWENLVAEFGDSDKHLEWSSVRECAEAGAQAQRGVLDQIHNDDGGFLGLGRVGAQFGDSGSGTTTNSFGQNISNDYVQGP